VGPLRADQRISGVVEVSVLSQPAVRLVGRLARSRDAPLAVVTCLGSSDHFLASHLPEESSPTTTELEETAKRLVGESLDRAFGGDVPGGASAVTWSGMLGNLGPVIAGNLVGGSLLVAMTYHVIYRRGTTP